MNRTLTAARCALALATSLAACKDPPPAAPPTAAPSAPTPTPAPAPTPTPTPTPAPAPAAPAAGGCGQLSACCAAIGNSLGGGTRRDCQAGLVGSVEATCAAKLTSLRSMAAGVGAELPAACH